ncbi:hypothetical protein N656DRAFT_383144 [Canariomyces notabilis]|uniref:Uncharacterized protein n=1 Tax=Canariomyces notabilis TaxID=2074819 RepID=A0AAN6TJ98_9PEZI|nr:hypothetical protein N656DRAFT_383144 [Canariomyces arenarius]
MACDANDRTATSTLTETPREYPTATVTATCGEMGRQPDSVISSIASQFLLDEASWDLGRFMPTTSTATPSPTPPPNPSPTPTPITPLTRGPIKCFNEADFPGHADIQPDDQDAFSRDFSALNIDTIGPDDGSFPYRVKDSHGVFYDYRVEWVAGCVTTVERQDFRFPLGMSQSLITAYLLVREDYTKCNNGGVGGSCQVGCLLYTFEGGRGGQVADSIDQGFGQLAVAQSQSAPSNHSHYVAGEDGGIVIDDLK